MSQNNGNEEVSVIKLIGYCLLCILVVVSPFLLGATLSVYAAAAITALIVALLVRNWRNPNMKGEEVGCGMFLGTAMWTCLVFAMWMTMFFTRVDVCGVFIGVGTWFEKVVLR